MQEKNKPAKKSKQEKNKPAQESDKASASSPAGANAKAISGERLRFVMSTVPSAAMTEDEREDDTEIRMPNTICLLGRNQEEPEQATARSSSQTSRGVVRARPGDIAFHPEWRKVMYKQAEVITQACFFPPGIIVLRAGAEQLRQKSRATPEISDQQILSYLTLWLIRSVNIGYREETASGLREKLMESPMPDLSDGLLVEKLSNWLRTAEKKKDLEELMLKSIETSNELLGAILMQDPSQPKSAAPTAPTGDLAAPQNPPSCETVTNT